MKNPVRVLGKALRLLPVKRFRAAMALGVGAAIEHRTLLRGLATRGIRCVVDIGANVGQFALCARECLPGAEILAFEPLASAAARFRLVHDADPRVRLVEAAVGPAVGTRSLHVSRAADSSSLLPIGAGQESLFPGTGESHLETVRVVRLEDEMPDTGVPVPTLVKIDVQGFELEVLRGCESRLDQIEFIYVECSFIELYEGQALAGEVVAWLCERDFRLAGIGSATASRQGGIVQADLLFERAPRLHVTGM
jgi:FkbM family methyltransferase